MIPNLLQGKSNIEFKQINWSVMIQSIHAVVMLKLRLNLVKTICIILSIGVNPVHHSITITVIISIRITCKFRWDVKIWPAQVHLYPISFHSFKNSHGITMTYLHNSISSLVCYIQRKGLPAWPAEQWTFVVLISVIILMDFAFRVIKTLSSFILSWRFQNMRKLFSELKSYVF